MKRYFLNGLMLLGLFFALIALIPTHSIASGNAQKGSAGLTKDMPEVQWYADHFHVSLDEAVRRLRLQDTIDDLDANIRKDYDDNFAGIYIQHDPEYKVVVQFARTIPSGIFQLIPESLRNDIEVAQVKFTMRELENARKRTVKVLENEGLDIVSATDIRHNLVIISINNDSLTNNSFASVDDIKEYLKSLDPTLLDKLNVGVNLITITPDDSAGNSSASVPEDYDWRYMKGGAMLRDGNMNKKCTAGFTVFYGLGAKYGISTAGHCADEGDPWDVKYYFTYIELHKEYGVPGPYDVAWLTPVGNWEVVNQIFIGSWGIKDIWADKWLWEQHPGDTVCKYGRETGPACTTILMYLDGVNVVTELEVKEGDSGGPWWLGDKAYGTTISRITFSDGSFGSCYAPVDHLYNQLHVRPVTWRP